ncbi:MAG: T9SS type A sorting domain-containing protein, partial [Paludibacter sp.]|nr:T9SS type A sorting domain-containing protein [Paludibacter sp.]
DARTFNNTFIYNGSSAQTIVNPAIGSGYHNLTLSGDGTKTLPASNVNIAGSLVLNAALTAASNTITFDGNTPQTLSGSSASALNNVTLNNANGLTLSKSQKVDGTLTLTNGLITTGSNVLSLGCNASTSGQSSSSYVNGILARDYCGIGAKLFPIGKGGAYRPLNIERTTGASGLTSIQSEQFEATITGILPANTTAFANRFWTITQPEGSQSYKIQIDGTDFTPNGTAVILKGNGNAQSTLTALSATTPNYTTVEAISSFSDFTLGSECLPPNISTHPAAQTTCELSVDAVTFTVTPEEGTYTYAWEVQTEIEGVWTTVSNGGVYSNATTSTLTITNPPFSMNGYAYRAVVTRTDCGSSSNSNGEAVLTVNPQPQGSLSGQTNICKGTVGSLTWTIPEGMGSFDITYKIGESGTPILLENVASGVPFHVGAITENTIFNLVSVKDRSTNCTRTAGFTQGSAEITVNPYITWTGATDTDWFKSSNWCGGVPTIADDVIIPDVSKASENEPVIGTSGAVTKSMIIDNNSSVTIDGAYTLEMAGSLTNNGLLDGNEGTLDIDGFIENNGTINTKSTLPARDSYGGNIILSGTNAQTLTGGTYYNIVIENAAGVTLPASATVNAQGTLEIKSGAKLEIGTGRTIIANRIDNKAGTSGILIKAAAGQATGSLIFNNTIEQPVQATVQHYSPASWTGTTSKTYFWQYMGIPVTKINNVDPTFYGAFVRKYNEPGWGETGDAINAPVKRWIQLFNGSSMDPVVGYELVQASPKTYTFSGQLFNADIDTTLSYTTKVTNISGQYPGQHVLSNPYATGIRISDIIFGNNMDSTVYIYNSGSYGQWLSGDKTSLSISAGKYTPATFQTAGTGGIPNEIPSMQGFLVRTNRAAEGSIYINYNNVKTPNVAPQRAPRRKHTWLRLNMKGATTADGDVMWLFSNPTTTRGIDNGWDAVKILQVVAGTPVLYSKNETGSYQINALPDIHNTEISFRPGYKDTEYTITINNENIESEYQNVYLFDIETGIITNITANNTEYTFNGGDYVNRIRFKILTALPSTTEVEKEPTSKTLNIFSSDNYIFADNTTSERYNLEIFDQTGRKVKSFISEANSLQSLKTELNPGVYIVRNSSEQRTQSTRVLIK